MSDSAQGANEQEIYNTYLVIGIPDQLIDGAADKLKRGGEVGKQKMSGVE